MKPLPDISEDDAFQAVIRRMAASMTTALQAKGADLGAIALVWIATEPEGNSVFCILGGDANPEALEHMSDCLLNTDRIFEETDLIIQRAN